MALTAKLETADALRTMERELHDLCQPLTTLQCRLELAQMTGDMTALREAVAGGLIDTGRLFAGIKAMQEHMVRALKQVKRDEGVGGKAYDSGR